MVMVTFVKLAHGGIELRERSSGERRGEDLVHGECIVEVTILHHPIHIFGMYFKVKEEKSQRARKRERGVGVGEGERERKGKKQKGKRKNRILRDLGSLDEL